MKRQHSARQEQREEQRMQFPVATGQARGKRRLRGTVGQWAAAAALAMAVLTGFGIEVSAEEVQKPGPYGLAFEGICKEGGGIYTETTEGDGNAWCQHEDDSQTVCDLNGNDCYHIENKSQEPTGWANPAVDATVDATITDDKQTLAPVDAPVDAPLEAIAEAPVDAPVESQVVSAAESGTLTAPVAAPVTLTEEPVAAEEPVVAETSAEQS